MIHTIRDIVITGSSAITAAGIGVAAVQELIRTGSDAFTDIPAEVLGTEGYRWGKATGFKVSDFMPPMKARKMDRCSQFAVAATGLALKDAGLDMKSLAPERVGIALGSGFCGISNSAEFLTGYFRDGIDGLLPMLFPNTVPNAPASNASIEHGFKGPNVSLIQRFCSAETAFLAACRFIEEGRADVMLTGGTDELLPTIVKGLASVGQLKRLGAPYGEGCGIVVLESAGHALRRGAVARASVECIRSVGMLVHGHEQEGFDLLANRVDGCLLASLSGCAADVPGLMEAVTGMTVIDVGCAVGRSLALGGTALAALVASLPAGERGILVSASPQGPYYSVDVRGGAPV
ncbi:MAG: beta-ketoacyl synthase N-terminal-like domain-containing protein [Desulfuromonadales bacterium]